MDISVPQPVDDGELPDLPSITGLGRFVSPDWERRFRLDGRRGERRALYLVVMATSATFAVFVANDISFVAGAPGEQFALLVGRAIIIGLCVAVAFYASRRRQPVDDVLTALAALVVLGEILIAMTRPMNFVGHVALELIAILGIYLLVPLPFVRQVALALAATAGHLAVLLGFKHGVPEPTLLSLTFGFLAVNLLGSAFSWQSNVARRRAFAFAQRERELREQVERAAAEAAALRELLPICASCKRVRDPIGEWHDLDWYLARHEVVRFSHGLCQGCAKHLYPELSDDDA